MEGYRRNGEYPFKGIDTGYSLLKLQGYLKVEMENTRLRELTHNRLKVDICLSICRNGEYPFKGIDTGYSLLKLQGYLKVEMENTRLRELKREKLTTIQL